MEKLLHLLNGKKFFSLDRCSISMVLCDSLLQHSTFFSQSDNEIHYSLNNIKPSIEPIIHPKSSPINAMASSSSSALRIIIVVPNLG